MHAPRQSEADGPVGGGRVWRSLRGLRVEGTSAARSVSRWTSGRATATIKAPWRAEEPVVVEHTKGITQSLGDRARECARGTARQQFARRLVKRDQRESSEGRRGSVGHGAHHPERELLHPRSSGRTPHEDTVHAVDLARHPRPVRRDRARDQRHGTNAFGQRERARRSVGSAGRPPEHREPLHAKRVGEGDHVRGPVQERAPRLAVRAADPGSIG
jgi:hypothetical protein